MKAKTGPVPILSRPTLQTLSEISGLSVTTVSRALSGSPQIAAKTRANVQSLAAELGYAPNRAAQRLKTGRSNVITLLLEPNDDALAFSGAVLHGITTVLRDTDFHLTIAPRFYQTDPVKTIEHIVRNRSADGVVFARTEPFDRRVGHLQALGFPFVTHGRTDLREEHAWVDFDNEAFAYQAAQHLIAKGRTNLGIVLPPRHLTYSQHLLHGFMKAVRENGLDHHIEEAITLDSDPRASVSAIERLLSSGSAPDAWICATDVMGFAVLSAYRSVGRSVSAGFDLVVKESSPLLGAVEPGVTTVSEDLMEAGMQLALLLIRRIEGEPPSSLYHLQRPRFKDPSLKAEN